MQEPFQVELLILQEETIALSHAQPSDGIVNDHANGYYLSYINYLF